MILLAASIEENIVLGRSEVTPSMLARAIRISGVDTWIGALSQGIKTRIGESGRSLSQGQCQMLSLARALVGDPRILILDEAFSQIDPASEKLIISRLPSIMAGRTCITVAHRLATARYSQRILVVRKGCIVEDGEHQALMDANGIYAGMVTLERLHRRADMVGDDQ
jgi:ABC-type bacteriocin/lantibiotic exporter with double-glycine peptidase domain